MNLWLKVTAAIAALTPATALAAALALAPASAASARHVTHCAVAGHARVRVPDVEGMVPSRARADLRRHHLRADFVPRPEGIVARQFPAPGRRAARCSAVALRMAATG